MGVDNDKIFSIVQAYEKGALAVSDDLNQLEYLAEKQLSALVSRVVEEL